MCKLLSHGGLFSGVGGFSIGAALAGIPTKWECELDSFCQAVLGNRFNHKQQYGNIKEAKGFEHVDIISAGFPCQDISVSGKGKGLQGSRSGLYWEAWRVVREVRPRFFIIENSPMLVVRGLGTILQSLTEIGYDAEWQCIPLSAFGANQERERIYLIAYPNEVRREYSIFVQPRSNNLKFPWQPKESVTQWSKWKSWFEQDCDLANGQEAYSPLLRVDDGLPSGLDKSRIEAMGNSVSPIVAHYLFECIKRRVSAMSR